MKSEDQYQRDQDSGGITPAVSPQTSKALGSTEGSTANEGMVARRTMSTVGHVQSRRVSPDEMGESRSGSSSIDPGGKRYSSKPQSRDQD